MTFIRVLAKQTHFFVYQLVDLRNEIWNRKWLPEWVTQSKQTVLYRISVSWRRKLNLTPTMTSGISHPIEYTHSKRICSKCFTSRDVMIDLSSSSNTVYCTNLAYIMHPSYAPHLPLMHVNKTGNKAAKEAKCLLKCLTSRDSLVLTRAFCTFVWPLLG